MKTVKVIDVSVRYDNQTYRAGESFKMKTEHINENLVDVVDDVKKDSVDLTVDEIKAELDTLGIDYKARDKRDELLRLLLDNKDLGDV